MDKPTEPQLNLARYALFAAIVASAGIPLYVHLPAFLASRYEVSLETLGVLLLVLRLVDFVQDPALGWLLSRLGKYRTLAVTVAIFLLAAGMVGLFAIAAPFLPLAWITGCLIVIFTGYSLLAILIYADGVERGKTLGHVRVATWREAGTLIGITAACLLPFALPGDGFRGFALIFAAVLLWAGWGMQGRWLPFRLSSIPVGALLADSGIRRFLLLAFLNAAPVAVTSTLFVFFVEDRLQMPGQAGIFLVLFFLSAAASAPVWRAVAARIGALHTLGLGMVLAIASFAWAFALGAGDQVPFAIICVTSGAALGADMMLLPALFSAHQARSGRDPALAFGFWNFAGKATLAISAGVVLPILGWSGFEASAQAGPEALKTLSLLYAVVPCGLKVVALLTLYLVVRPNLNQDQSADTPEM